MAPRATPKHLDWQPCSGSRAGAAQVPLGTPCHGAASLPGKKHLCQPCCLPSPGLQLALLRSATLLSLSQAMSTREESTGSSQTRGALESRSPAVLTGCWDRHDCPWCISPSVVSLSPSSLRGLQELHTPKPQRQRTVPPVTATASSWVSPQLSSCLVQHSSRSTGIHSGTTPSAQADTPVPRQIRAAVGTSLHSLTHPHQKLGSSWDMRGSCKLCRG